MMNMMNARDKASYGALVLRLSLGVMYIAHGLLKLLVFTLPGAAHYFSSLGLPGGLAYGVTAAELAGGLMLITGVYARFVALALVPDLLGAIIWVHAQNGWLFTNPGGGWEYPAFLIAASLALFIMGDSAFALAPCPRGPQATP